MSHTRFFDRFKQLTEVAEVCDRRGIGTREGLELAREKRLWSPTRRGLIASAGALAAGAALPRAAWAGKKYSTGDVAIVGGGLAGLVAAYELQLSGVASTIYEASTRSGGRCYSLRGFFPGQVAERGGEFIDTGHKTMLAYANELGLTLEDVEKDHDEIAYWIDGVRYDEAEVVEEYRALVAAMKTDLRSIGAPTADSYTAGDEALDYVDLETYLSSRGAGRLIHEVVRSAYVGEYGLEIEEQSCLAFLLFIHADRRSKFKPFGVFSDERYHVVEGNDAIAQGLADSLDREVQLGHSLVAARRDATGKVTLTFEAGGRTVEKKADAVVFALPFSALRNVDTSGLDLPDWKQQAIDELQYGTNAKQMVGFKARPWRDAGYNGTVYGNGAHIQVAWETNPASASATAGVLTDYSGGIRGATLDTKRPTVEAEAWLAELESVFPGASAAARRDASGKLVQHLEHWPSKPTHQGSYTANHLGYFTTIADREGTPVDNLFFAGEHADSFYSWQGFMEGACLSGLRVAGEILAS